MSELKEYRKGKGLTQSKVAEILGVGLRTVQHWEKGDRQMQPAFMELLKLKVGK